MGKGDILGGFEHLILAATARLKDSKSKVSNASGSSVTEEIEARTERKVSIGAVCTGLDRLEKKGYLSSEISDREGRRPRRFYSLTPSGQQALLDALNAVAAIWDGLELKGMKRPQLSLKAADLRRGASKKDRTKGQRDTPGGA